MLQCTRFKSLRNTKPESTVSVISILEEIRTDKYKSQIESMEGAALHYIGRDLSIPFIQIRAVSNYVGERNKAKWKMQEAIYNLNETVLQYLDALSTQAF